MISNPPGRLAGDFANLAGANSQRILPLGARSR